MFVIYMSGTDLAVNDKNQIITKNWQTPSDSWRFDGFYKVLPFGHLRKLTIEESLELVRTSLYTRDWRFKTSGNPRYKVADIDHNTNRILGDRILDVTNMIEQKEFDSRIKGLL